jgi:ribosomal-protein-alanine N-acetyltransferase
MDEAFAIRQMCYSDLDEIAEIEKLSFPIPWSRDMLEDELFNPRAWYRVAAFEGRIAGYAGMWKILDEGHITNIAVHPDFRRRGLGAALLRDLIEHAESCGINALTLEVRVGNKPAICLYESLGFTVEGRRKRYYQDNHEDALIMWLRIR